MNHISETSTSIHDLIKTKENEALKRHNKTCEDIQDINDKLNDHEIRHQKEDDAIKKNRTAIDNLSEHIESEFKQMKEKQCNNEQVLENSNPKALTNISQIFLLGPSKT